MASSRLQRIMTYKKATKPYGRKPIKARIAYDYRIANCSWPIHLLRVNREARGEAMIANPHSIQINSGPRVFFNTQNNIIHFDYEGLHVLKSCIDERQNPERILKGFESIVNLSISTVGNFKVFNELRSASTLAVLPFPFYAPLSGVTFVEVFH